MLYKKYHRDFVRKFKVGAKIKVYVDKTRNKCMTTIQRGPYKSLHWIFIKDGFGIRALILRNGRLRIDIEIVEEDAIQEIS